MSGLKSNKPLTGKKPLIGRVPLRKNLKPKSKQAKPSVTKLKKDARKFFNRAIKYRDSELIEDQWLFICITCPRRILFKDREGRFYRNAHAGHFQPETYSNTRFNELNVNGQCGMCNFNQGEQVRYARALELKYGEGTAADLEAEAKVPKQWTIAELEQIIADAKEEIRWYESQERNPDYRQAIG